MKKRVLVFAILSACSAHQDPPDCADVESKGAQVWVVDTEGNPVTDAEVTFSFEGGTEEEVTCLDGSSWVAYGRGAGTVDIRVRYNQPDPNDAGCSFEDQAAETVEVYGADCAGNVGPDVLVTLEIDTTLMVCAA